MSTTGTLATADAISRASHPLLAGEPDYEPLTDLIGDAPYVLLGEASHGTDEFYRERAEITKRLVESGRVQAIAVEADWPDAYRVNCYVQHASDDTNADEALADFQRFPTWMWRNEIVRDFVEWLRNHNASLRDGERKVGFYGLDLYSLSRSAEAVITYLDDVDPAAAQRARKRYGCFEYFANNDQAYGYSASTGVSEPCEDEVVEQLLDLQSRTAAIVAADGHLAEDRAFYAEQNARLVIDAERYYRSMFQRNISSWNLRDIHMADTLDALEQHLTRYLGRVGIAVWAHNSHLGDARATGMGASGELNLGQLVRQRHGDQVRLIGFTTHRGWVTAASNWDEPPEFKQVRPALPESYEALFHETGIERFFLPLNDGTDISEALRERRLERAIGVIYRPETERWSHYFDASLPDQFDAVLHFDESHAVRPLEHSAGWPDPDLPETYPFTV
ncbi:MAG: erythromycin esterase family protein [Thermomicrobiales bacterium]